jgi:hypothetical protein
VVGIGEEAEEIAPAAPAYGSERLGGEEKEPESFRWNILLAVGFRTGRGGFCRRCRWCARVGGSGGRRKAIEYLTYCHCTE